MTDSDPNLNYILQDGMDYITFVIQNPDNYKCPNGETCSLSARMNRDDAINMAKNILHKLKDD